MAKKPKWKSSIVGHDKVRADQLLANPANHRRHPQKQRDIVAASIEELGFCKSVIVNKRTGNIVDGHERVMQALGVGDETLVDVEYVDLSEADERKLLLILDASSELAETDADSLDDLLRSVQTGSDALGEWFTELAESAGLVDADDEREIYSRKVEAPGYVARGQKPSISELVNQDVANGFLAQVEKSTVSSEVKDFLRLAAQRHLRFDYEKIAEFYCHADQETQSLMESLALVLIDYNKAIELGYVDLSKKLAVMFGLEHPDEE